MKTLLLLYFLVFSAGAFCQTSAGSSQPDWSVDEVDQTCFWLDYTEKILSCYKLQTEEACTRKVEFTVNSGSGESVEIKFGEGDINTAIKNAVEEARSLLQKLGQYFLACYESQADTQQCQNTPIIQALVEEKVFCVMDLLLCSRNETESECKDRKNREVQCNIEAVASAQKRFCIQWEKEKNKDMKSPTE